MAPSSSQSNSQINAASDVQAKPPSGKVILIVDDEADILDILQSVVQDMGYQPLLASGGEAALALLESHKIDIILTDVRMPNVSGLDLFRQVKEKKVPVIFMSGFAGTLDAKQAKQMGAADFLAKPFTSAQLQQSLDLVEIPEPRQTERLSESTPGDAEDWQYCPIFIPELLEYGRKPIEVFLKDPKKGYVCIAKMDQGISDVRLRAVFEKGLFSVFLRKSEYAQLHGLDSRSIVHEIKAKVPTSIEARLEFIRESVQEVVQFLKVDRLQAKDFEFGRGLVESVLKIVFDNDVVFQIIATLRKQYPLAFRRSLAAMLVGGMASRQVGWTGRGGAFKVALAGLFHDVGVIGLPADLIERTVESMRGEELKHYQEHPLRSRELLREIPFIPEEVIQSVTQHHENNSGTGFPQGLSRIKIHPLARMLCLVDTFCDQCLPSVQVPFQDAEVVLKRIYLFQEADFESAFVRALYDIYSVPLPDKLKNANSKFDSRA